jgi:signal peptidase I
MSEIAPLPSPDEGEASPRQPFGTRRRLLAALFSAIVPGAGQFFLGQRRKGGVLLAIFVLLLFCFWPLRLLRFYSGLVSLYCIWIALYLYAAGSAQLARPPAALSRPSRLWLLVVIPIGLVTLSLLGRLATRAAGFRSFSVPSTSMEETIRQGDYIVVDSSSRSPKRQEVFVFLRDKTFWVKRVMALGGDSIQGKNGAILVNGQYLEEPYVEHTGEASPWMNNFGPITIAAGELFVMGDNRDVSLDSRSPEFGPVSLKSIIGKPLYVFSTDRAGKGIK